MLQCHVSDYYTSADSAHALSQGEKLALCLSKVQVVPDDTLYMLSFRKLLNPVSEAPNAGEDISDMQKPSLISYSRGLPSLRGKIGSTRRSRGCSEESQDTLVHAEHDGRAGHCSHQVWCQTAV